MKDYKRLTDRVIAEMLRNTEGESWDSDNVEAQCYIRLADLENKIESGEFDYVADSKTEQTITDLLIEFDEMGFAPTTVCENPEQYAIDWRERARKEFDRQTAELEKYKRALSKVIKDRNVLAKDFYYMVEGEGQLYEDYYLGWVEHEMQEERKND